MLSDGNVFITETLSPQINLFRTSANKSTFGAFSFVLFAIPAGKLADRIGDKRVLAGGFLSAIASYLNLAFFSSIASVILGFLLG